MIAELQAELRDPQPGLDQPGRDQAGRGRVGRSGSRQLRRAGKVPAIVYGGSKGPQAIAIDHNALEREMNQPAFHTSILTVRIGNEPQAVVVKDVQRHPFKPLIVHMDFQRIVEDQAITLHVPIHFIGEEVAKGVKEQGGVIEHLATDLEVSCLPRNLPEHIDVDVTHLELNQILHVSDLKLPEDIKLVALEHDQDLPIVTISQPRREEAEEGAEEGAEAEGGAVE